MKRFLFPILICIFYFISYFIVVPFAAFPLTSEINRAQDLSKYNDIYDFSNLEIVDTMILPYSTLFLLEDSEHQELLLLQAEKYFVYSRYRFILNPQPIFSGRSMEIDDLVAYKMEVWAIDRRLVVEESVLIDESVIIFLFLGLICIISLIRSARVVLRYRA